MIIPATEPSQQQRFISCGMYAFTDRLRLAWQALFDSFYNLIESPSALQSRLNFDASESTLRDPDLFIGHTCGYPLMFDFADALSPVCVPVFEVAGAEHKSYSSLFIVAAESEHESLADCFQSIAVINGRRSNSGMNAFRHAIAPLARGGIFFSDVVESGSHKQSLFDVADGRADIAAIDCVSFAMIADAWPDRVARVRCLGYSATTCGLPFVSPKPLLNRIDKQEIVATLNQALANLPDRYQADLHLGGFETVELEAYQGIADLEIFAQQTGYAELR